MTIVRRVVERAYSLAQRILGNESGRVLLIIVIAWGGFSLWQNIQAPGKIEPALLEIMKQAKYTPRIEVDLGFTPEDFHITYLQRFGAMAGVEDQRIFLIQVPAERLWDLARVYWIREIRLAK